MNELTEFGQRVARITDPATLRRIVDKGGMAGKEAALDAAASDLGGDRSFSGLRRKAPLGAGYDAIGGTSVQINFRPSGLWMLAEAGRRQSGAIYPRTGARKGKGTVYRRAVMTPQGPRARSSYRPSRGLGTYTDAVRDARVKVPKAAFRQFQVEVGKLVR